MSKKKSFSGSTMTLKDFHGGSIPSDLALPSAPGVSARPPDRWGPPSMGIRSDAHHRPRPGSAGGGSGGARLGPGFGVDERGPPFLSTPVNIGRHFDEDERKPFDASAAFPRRSAPVPDPVSRPLAISARCDQKPPAQPQPQPRSGPGTAPNAWGLRKEETKPVLEPVQPVQASSGASLSSRFAQASAIDQVSSGRWKLMKPVTPSAADGEAVRFEETVRVVDEARVSSPLHQEVKERGFGYNEGARPVSNEGRSGGVSQMHQQQQGLGLEGGERPKLKLLPRSRPMEGNDTWFLDEKQEHQPTIHPVRVENSRELQGNMNMPRPGSAGADIGDRGSERPRLNLKPRSLPVEQSDDITEKERKSVFGGARPRELVLKERGVDDVVANSQEVISPAHSHRVKSDSQRTDMKSRQEPPALATRRGERSDSSSVDQRSGREFEKKDARSDHEKVDNLRASWRNDNWKNTREIERPAERRPEPETWRKPVEQPKQEVPGTASRHGKAASALELAQAFSRSVSDPRSDNHFPSQRSSTGLGQAPFSRLTDTTRDFYSGANPRHINGY